jgi:hypothetical protein
MMGRFLHVLSHVIIWRRCDCFAPVDPAQSARLDAWAQQWAEMDHKQRRAAFGR